MPVTDSETRPEIARLPPPQPVIKLLNIEVNKCIFFTYVYLDF